MDHLYAHQKLVKSKEDQLGGKLPLSGCTVLEVVINLLPVVVVLVAKVVQRFLGKGHLDNGLLDFALENLQRFQEYTSLSGKSRL